MEGNMGMNWEEKCGYKDYLRNEYRHDYKNWWCEHTSKELYRSRRGLVFGVCQGVAEWLGIPAWPLRVAMIIALIASGFYPAVVVYLLAAIIMKPED